MSARFLFVFLLCVLAFAGACDAKPAARREAPPATQAVEPVPLPPTTGGSSEHPPSAHLPPAHPPLNVPLGPAADGALIKGEVLETMNAASYTYVRLRTEDGAEVWAAGPQAAVSVGQRVELPPGMVMHDFVSKALGRSFKEILFVDQLIIGAQPLSQQGQGGPAKVEALDLPKLSALEGGLTVAQLFDDPAAHAGQVVRLRAAVVHQNSAILGRNWLHVQDGTRSAKDQFDLTVTTTQAAQPGDVLIIQGKVSVDRDFGAGYRYDVLIEDAQIEVERR